MHTLEIPDKDIYIKIPSNWDEATREQASQVFEFALNLIVGVISKDEYNTSTLFFLTGMKRTARTVTWEKLAPEEIVLEKNAKIYQMGETYCQWPFLEQEDPNATPQIKYETVRNNLPVITIGRKKLYGPADLIADLTFGEFRAAIEEMNTHLQLAKDPETAAQSEVALDRFLACLYRPAKTAREKLKQDDDGRLRTHFNRAKINTKYTSKFTVWQKTMILLWFSYCIKYLQTGDLLVNNNEINLSALFPEATSFDSSVTPEETTNSGIGWVGLLFDIAKEGVFGDAKTTDKQNIFDILLYLYNNHLKQQKSNRK